jgi:hypothetical protein
VYFHESALSLPSFVLFLRFWCDAA